MCLYSEKQVFGNVYCAKINISAQAIKKIFIITGTVSNDLRKCAQVIVSDYSLDLFQNSVIHDDFMLIGLCCHMSSLKIPLVGFCLHSTCSGMGWVLLEDV